MKKLFKKLLPFLTIGGFISLFTPIYSVKAFSWFSALNMISPLYMAGTGGILIVPLLWLALTFGSIALSIQGAILESAIGNPFAFSYTNPATNPVINIGWTLLRDIANTLFILGLSYIGLATALNLGGFNTKKAFGRLIVAALLINFTPVICGTIVDASNLIMNLFTSNIAGAFNVFGSLVSGGWGSVWDILASFTVLGAAKLLVIIIYQYFTSFVLFVFTFLLLARHIAIWILVIISPIAFFCWIFDSTKKHFTTWWNQFIHWTFIGITAAFALYLSGHLLNAFAGK